MGLAVADNYAGLAVKVLHLGKGEAAVSLQ